MTTEKQLIANQQNALASTGPITIEGKAIVATNPVKHGIFTKSLIVDSSIYGERESDYLELLENLKSCFNPQNQMESLLVEKIAIDFWRLRRVIRFEAGGIEEHLGSLFRAFYNYGKRTNLELDKQIEHYESDIIWINTYIKCLKNNQVEFDSPTWKGEGIESNITEDLYLLARNLPTLSYQEKEALPYDNFAKLKVIVEFQGYTSKTTISNRLVELYLNEIQRLESAIKAFKKDQLENMTSDNLNCMLGSLPHDNKVDKVLKYERSLQKSIFQNLFLLKKLQGVFQ